MHPIHDIDVILILALLLSSKRRPAELTEIVAATDLINGSVPPSPRMVQAFGRLGEAGLVVGESARFSLTPAAQALVTGLPKKADHAERIFALKERLRDYETEGESASAAPTEAQMNAAILAFRASTLGGGKNMLVPKPKVAEDPARAGHWRKRAASKKRG